MAKASVNTVHNLKRVLEDVKRDVKHCYATSLCHLSVKKTLSILKYFLNTSLLLFIFTHINKINYINLNQPSKQAHFFVSLLGAVILL